MTDVMYNNIFEIHEGYRIRKEKILTVKYIGNQKSIQRRFNGVVKVKICLFANKIITVNTGNDSMGLQSVHQFHRDWEILDRRVLIEKTGCYI